jgi:hypothetical protein
VWSNALGCEQVLFHWSTAEPSRLVIAAQRYARLEGGAAGLVLVDEQGWDETIDTAVAIWAGHGAVGSWVTLLELDDRLSFNARFALVHRHLQPKDDLAGWILRRGSASGVLARRS